MEITWQAEDGYAGGARPQYFELDASEYEGWSLEDIETDLEDQISEEFMQKITWSADVKGMAKKIFQEANDGQ